MGLPCSFVARLSTHEVLKGHPRVSSLEKHLFFSNHKCYAGEMINLVRARKKSRVEILSTNGLLGASPNLIVGGRDIYTPKVTRATNLGVEKKLLCSCIFPWLIKHLGCSSPSFSQPRLFHGLLTQQLILACLLPHDTTRPTHI